MLNQFTMFIPEIALAMIAMIMQIVAVFSSSPMRRVSFIAILMSFSIIIYLLCSPVEYSYYNGSFLTSPVINGFKAIILGITLLNILIYRDFVKIDGKGFKMEFVTLMLLSTVGIFISVSARDFLLLFCGLELQALSGYALTAFNIKDEKSSEAGLKYFILGALMSGVMLFGVSFLYGFSGSINFLEIKSLMSDSPVIGLVIGSVLVLSAVLFKLSIVPLHAWTPDVYEGSPISSTSYFATSQKVGMLLVLINIVDGVIGDYAIISETLLKIVAVLSMVVGAVGAIRQESLKRLMAYSTILNMGYVLLAVSLNSIESNNAAYIYVLIYAIGTVGFFASLVALFGKHSDNATFDNIKGISKQRKTIAAVISIIMFSMIGLPPFAGFFGKYYIFINAIEKQEYMLVIIAAATSAISAFYYLKIVKYMYFMQSDFKFTKIPTKKGLWVVTTISVTFTVFFFTFAHKYIV